MNINELADVAGVSRSTISRTAKKMYPDLIKRGVKTDFSKDQCFDIMRNTNRKSVVEIEDVQPVQKNDEVAQVQPQSIAVIAQAVAIAMQSVMMPMFKEMMASTQKALPEPLKEDFYSLVGYCAVNKITVNRSELATHGRELKKMSRYKNLEVKKIPDERWGTVNSYPVEILDEYFKP